MRTLLFSLLLFTASGCGSWEFVSVRHRYQEPPELPLEGLATYAVLVEGAGGAELDPQAFVVPGLQRVDRPGRADVVARVLLGELRTEPMEVFQRAQWTARGERAFDKPRYGIRWRYVIPVKYQLLDRSRGDRVLRQEKKEYAGLFQRPGALFSTQDAARAWYAQHEGEEWIADQQKGEAAHAVLARLQELLDEVVSPHHRFVRLRLAKDSPELEGFQQAYVILRTGRRPGDGEAAREIYASIGNPLRAATDPEDAKRHRHALACGFAACDFLTGNYRGARQQAQVALEQRPSETLDEFIGVCEVMIRRTELPPPQPLSAKR